MPVCNLDWKIQGPYNQTLFLGCSISDFNINLGWKGEASTCTVKLVRDRAKHPSSSQYNALNTSFNTTVSNTNNSTLFDPQITSPDNSKSLTKNVAQKLVDTENTRTVEDIARISNDNERHQDTGKVAWVLPSKMQKLVTESDPGFVGKEGYSIIGCPVYFKFHNLEFGGYIKTWTDNRNDTFDVELSSFGSLLGGCKLILQQYRGSVSTLLNTTGGSFAVPYANPNAGGFNGTIADGNVPNLFNIFGWLEDQGFGFSGASEERGIPAIRVYNALQTFLGGAAPNPGPFSPYGGILSKGVSRSDNNEIIDTKNATIGQGPGSLKLTECGFLPTVTGTDGINRCLFLLDIAEVPPPPDIVFFNQTEISIIDFINTCCEEAGFDYFVDLIPGNSSTYSGIIKIRTVSRRIQPPVNILKNFIDSISGQNGILSVSVGEEFSDSQVKSVVVGGQQERLYQVCCHTLSRYRSHNRYDPEDGLGVAGYPSNLSETNLSNGNVRNTVRSPLGARTRWYDYAFIDGAIVAQETNQEQYFSPQNLGFSTMSVYAGGYETSTPPLGSFATSSSYPLYADLISPYFGRDSQGFLRKVFFDTNTSQLQVLINTADIKSCFPTFTINGHFLVYENELRAALSGIDQWLTYISETSKYGARTFTAGLIFNYLNSTYGPVAAKALFMAGLGVIRSPGKTSALPSVPPTNNPLSPDSAISYTGPILDILQKLHNFFRDLAKKHYGKEFLVRLPLAQTTVDSSNVRQYDYTIADSGWEEPGNFIDDTIPIGTSLADNLMQEDGKFGVILGYNNLGEKYTILDTPGQGITGLLNKLRGAFTTNAWYLPLTTEIDPQEVYVAQWGTATLPGSFEATNNPWVSRNPIANNEALLSTSIFPALYNTGFGDNINDDTYKYKIYVKGSCQDVATENKYNKKMIYDPTSNAAYCVVSAPGKVWINSPRSLAITIIEDLLLSNSLALPRNRLLVQWAACLNNLPAMINSTTPSTNSMEIVPRAALPCFVAVPVRLNRFTYGPWSSHPYLIRNLIFPGADDSTAMTNNIIGGVKIEIDPQLVPWNYGGIEQLDFAVLNKIASDNNYQQIIEKGSITYAGIQMGQNGIGYRLIDANMGPIINSIVVSVGQDGVKTTLSLRTYSRKLGFYNKEAADNIQKIATESIKRRKEISDNIRSLSFANTNTSSTSDFTNSRPKALNWSPVSILVGNAYPFLHNNSSITDACASAGLSYTPSWHLRPKIPSNVVSSPSNLIRHQTQASLYDPGELPAVFKDVPYSGTSIMSMDGLLSPISFYPTPHGSTYAISFYSRSFCPYCKGVGVYSYERLNLTNLDNGPPETFPTLKSKVEIQTEPCRFCVPDNNKQILRQKSVKPVEHLPPFIVATGTDLTIINNSQNTFASNSPIINRYTLNPMVMSSPASEFSCTTNKQASDSCAHSIDAVAFGNSLDEATGGLRAHLSNTINSNYGNNNVRFFGLRGPIMVHAWGYDTEGYPVPNASGEFKIENGNIVRDNNGNPVFKNQILQSDGTYSAPYKENAFFKGWAQLPSTWPVGPIDLRWDNDAGVWSIGSNYKPMWVVLENDLTNTEPVRGTILEGYADNEPLPNGLRKLVFVKDSTKLFSAPRGAAIYCKYNSSNGFYEPIYNQPFITSGVINGSSLATIYKAYNTSTITPDDATPSSYQTNFVNPLELNAGINSVGLFIYLNGNWTLQSVKN